MTEKEILNLQEQNGQQQYYLMLMGTFYHAYGCGAFALARTTGYRVMRKHRKDGDILTCGFPLARLEEVISRLQAAGGSVCEGEGKIYLFSGIDGTPDEALVCEPKQETVLADCKSARTVDSSWLADAVMHFNLSLSTPMDAMNLIASLQRRLRDEQQQQNQQEESPRESATDY